MLNPYVSAIVYGIESLIYYALFARMGKQKFPPWICILIGLALFEIISLINLLFRNSLWINVVVTIPVTAFFSHWCFQKRLIPAFCASAILTTLELALEMIVILGISSIISVRVTEYNTNLSLLILEFLSCKAPFFLVSMILSNMTSDMTIRKIPAALFVYPTSAMCCLFIFWYISLSGRIDEWGQALLAITSGILLVSSIFLFHTFQREAEKDSAIALIQGENKHLRMEKDYYNILEQQNKNLLMYAHDTKKHLTAIQELNDDPRIDEYVTSLCGQLKAYTQSCHSGNKLLDVMISRYQLDARLRDISFEYDVTECNLLGVDDLDLVAILGNLMDNAFGAAEQSNKRLVNLTTASRNSYSIVLLKNSCDVPPNAQGEKLLSTKKDSKFHGYGLKSVIQTLRKYKGDFYWTYSDEDQVFTATVMLKAKAQES